MSKENKEKKETSVSEKRIERIQKKNEKKEKREERRAEMKTKGKEFWAKNKNKVIAGGIALGSFALGVAKGKLSERKNVIIDPVEDATDDETEVTEF